MNPITAVEQITPDWLTGILQQQDVLHSGRVLSVQSDTNLSSEGGPGFRPNQRLHITYTSDAPAAAPARLYIKLNDGAFDTESGRREVIFYTDIAAAMPISPTVACYHAAHNPETGAYHLLLEDVSATHATLEREAPAPKADMLQMLDLLAQFHAHWWNHPRLERDIGFVDADLAKGNLNVNFSGFIDFMGDRLSLKRRTIYEKILAVLPGLLSQRFRGGALTLVHDDAHVWNFLLPHTPDPDRAYLIDWQQWGGSFGPHDVAYLMTLFWYRERRARLEQDLVKHYHRQLMAHDVAGYPWDDCWHDYRLATIRCLMTPLWAWSGGYWWFHRWMQLEKAMLAFEDLNCMNLLETK